MVFVVTGVNGFTGGYLIKHLRSKHKSSFIIGVDLKKTNKNELIDLFFSIDEYNDLQKILSKKKNIAFFHLGGIIHSNSISEYINNNVRDTIKYLEIMKNLNIKVFLNVGSSAEYGYQKSIIVKEDAYLNPVSNYGISKMLQYIAAKFYADYFKVPFIHVRTFNLVGPGLRDYFVCGKIINEVKEIEMGLKKIINFNGDNSFRDFIDVRDAVTAYELLAINSQKLTQNVFNIGSGKSYSILDILEIVQKLTKKKLKYKFNPTQASPILNQIADISLIMKQIGWSPKYSLTDSLNGMYESGR